MAPMSGTHTTHGGKRRFARIVRTVPAALLASSAVLLTNGSPASSAQEPAPAAVTAPAGVLAAAAVPVAARTDDEQLALDTLDEVVRGDFTAVSGRFDETLRHQASPELLARSWQDYQEQFGPYRSHGDPRQVASVQGTVVNVPLNMAKRPGEFRVTFNEDGLLTGLFFLRTGIPVP
ncbi:DUF3887 domain-containing protein [Streptomyces sp. NBC_00435]|uniref:DUF3887 domain-containing protein n=1 Tax=Streptomyces sp. NBC_00435 TaxID=2903649 RepID=UPI002E1B7E61